MTCWATHCKFSHCGTNEGEYNLNFEYSKYNFFFFLQKSSFNPFLQNTLNCQLAFQLQNNRMTQSLNSWLGVNCFGQKINSNSANLSSKWLSPCRAPCKNKQIWLLVPSSHGSGKVVFVFVCVHRTPYPQTFCPEGLSRRACCLSLFSLRPLLFFLYFIALDSKRVHSWDGSDSSWS